MVLVVQPFAHVRRQLLVQPHDAQPGSLVVHKVTRIDTVLVILLAFAPALAVQPVTNVNILQVTIRQTLSQCATSVPGVNCSCPF